MTILSGYLSKPFAQIMVIALWLLAVPATANQAAADVYSMSLEQLLDVKITGSTLTEENIKTVPSAVTVFTHEQIKRLGLDSLDELMNLVPGYQSYRNGDRPRISAFSSRGRRIGATSAEILIMIDGQRSDEARTNGTGGIMPKIPLMQIERVEFIRSPGSAVYGSNAMLGVINIITRSNANEVNAGYGSFDRYKVDILASEQLGEVKLFFFAHYDADNGDYYEVQDTFSSDRIKTDDPNEIAELNIKLEWRNTELNFKYNQTNNENFYFGNFISNDINEQNIEYSSISLKQSFDWKSVSSWFFLGYSQSEILLDGQFTGEGALLTASGGTSNAAAYSKVIFNKNSELRMQWHNDWSTNENNNLQFGFEYRRLDIPEGILKSNFDSTALTNGDFPIASSDAVDLITILQSESRRDIFGLYSQFQRKRQPNHI